METKSWRDCFNEMTDARNQGNGWIVMVLIAAVVAVLLATGVLSFPSFLMATV